MEQYTKGKESSATSSSSATLPPCTGCPKISSPDSGSALDSGLALQLTSVLTQNLNTIDKLQKDILRVEQEQDKTRAFYHAITKLSNASRVVIGILMTIPLIQLVLCVAMVYYLGIQDNLPGLLTWVLGGISLFSLAEVIAIPIQYFILSKRVEDVEKKVDKLTDNK